MTVHVLGIRHHGPGSARAVAAALVELTPDAVLIEGPADVAPALLALVAAEGMSPPVALLGYVREQPAIAAFWPFATFSPEWQALSWALANDVPVRFCDLPAAMVLAAGEAESSPRQANPPRPDRVRADPLAMLAEAAGYDDPERWWDDVIESRNHRIIIDTPDTPDTPGRTLFPAITEAMTELRLITPPDQPNRQLREDRREAYMRNQLRAVLAEGAQRVVVVCGAWHAPALTGDLAAARRQKPPTATADAKLLRGIPKRKVALTWVPWTHSRLSAESGYGAGITSPGWYQHLFNHPELTVSRWLTKVARVLRTEDLPVSSASVIEAVRLAEALGTLRGRQLAGLDEVTEATRSVLVNGDDVALALVTSRLVVGEALGQVPAQAPTVPLEADLRAQARRLRLKFEAGQRALDLDLRKPGDLERSHLLHRLTLLGVPWAVPAVSSVQGTGTFRESWRLSWQPGLSVSVIEAAIWGSTVQTAALARLADTAGQPNSTVPQLTEAVEACLLADLPAALDGLLAALNDRAAVDLDLEHLTAALPALVRALRYGDVRGTDTSALTTVTHAVLTRICLALPLGVTSLDDTGSAALRRSIDAVHSAIALLDHPGARRQWLTALTAVIDRPDVHGLIIGRLVRILRDAGELDSDAAAVRLARALSVGTRSSDKAAWVEGFFSGGGLLLVHDRELLALLDSWVVVLDEQDFVDVLPLLRRTFGEFAPAERRGIGERVRNGSTTRPSRPAANDQDPALDERRATLAMSTVADVLGVRT